VEAPPSAAFEVAQSEFLLQFLVVPFNEPAMLRNPDEVLQLGLPRRSSTSIRLWP